MSLHVRQAGVWEDQAIAYVRVAGTWEPSKVYVRVAGVWKPILGVVTITDATYYDSGIGNAEATVFFRSDGTKDATDDTGTETQRDSSTDWIIDNSLGGSDFEIHVTSTGDSLAIGSDSEGTWLSLGSDRQWGVATGSGGNLISADLTVQIRHAASQIVLDSGTITVTADTT